jgi:hypothetical protein
MSLMRLLAAGSSLVGIKDRPSPYRMTQQHLLPKFGAGKPNEARVAGRATLAVPEPESPTEQEPVGRPGIVARDGTPQVHVLEYDEKKLPPAVASRPLAEQAPKRSPALQSAAVNGRPPAKGLFRRWARMLNPFGTRPPERKKIAPVQGELRLEGVKVVRNDLSECDLEIVPAVEPAEAAIPPVPTGGNPEAERVAWRRIAARLFGAGRT